MIHAKKEKAPPTPYDDARWHLGRAQKKLSGFWLGLFWRVRDARENIEQARLAVAAIEEMEGTAVVDRVQK